MPRLSAKSVLSNDRQLLLTYLETMVGRYLAHKDYGWVDTKFNLVSGENFAADDPIRGLSTIYGWIQGRALESLTGHLFWLKALNAQSSQDGLITNIELVISRLLERVYGAFKKNHGHLFFTMHSDGSCFRFDGQFKRGVTLISTSPYAFSDQFAAKGMLAAAAYLDKTDMLEDIRQLVYRIHDALFEHEFMSDQYAFDSRNTAGVNVAGRLSHAPFMIQIGLAAMLLDTLSDKTSIVMGIDLIRHILQYHVNMKKKSIPKFAFWEYIDSNGEPWIDNGQLISDPGHCLEFVGLSLKFTAIAKTKAFLSSKQSEWIEEIESILSQVLVQNFKNGFQEYVGGICKTYDLIGRAPVNGDMPWWSLPETMRAAIYSYKLAGSDADRTQMWQIFEKCHNVFIKNYIMPGFNRWPVQNRDRHGSVSSCIPAVPDADPSYHTGLCLIDCMKILSI